MTQPLDPPEDPRVRFAAERTLLAWVRTGIALMGFGFVVARFGLFLRELATAANQPARPAGPSMVLGVSLTVLGVIITSLAGLEYRTVLRGINGRQPYSPPRFSLALIMSVVLAAMGLATTAYLLTL